MTCFILLITVVLTGSAIILAGHISAIMSKLSEIHCQCQCFNLFCLIFTYRLSFSFPHLHLSFTSYYTLHPRIALYQWKWKKTQNKLSDFLSLFPRCSRSIWEVIIVFHLACCLCSSAPPDCDWAAKPHIRAGLPPLARQGTAHCHSAGNWKGNEMWYLLCMSPLPHLRDRADVSFTIFKENETRVRMMEMHWGDFAVG